MHQFSLTDENKTREDTAEPEPPSRGPGQGFEIAEVERIVAGR